MDASKEIAYGAVAGCLAKIIEFPFDTVKVRLQSASNSPSTVAMLRHIYLSEGIINGFYKGLKAPLVGACLETAVIFGAYEKCKNGLHNLGLDQNSLLCVCTSGAFSGIAASFVLTPVELVKCNLQIVNTTKKTQDGRKNGSNNFQNGTNNFQNGSKITQNGSNTFQNGSKNTQNGSNTFQNGSKNTQNGFGGKGLGSIPKNSYINHSYGSVMRQIVQKNGVSGLWSGLSSTILRESVGTAIWFATYEKTNAMLSSFYPGSKNTNNLVSGATAGFIFNLSIYPVDTIKSNIQTSHTSGRNYPSLSIRSVLESILATPGGARNLYNGLGITLVRCIPANATIFYVYEWLKENA